MPATVWLQWLLELNIGPVQVMTRSDTGDMHAVLVDDAVPAVWAASKACQDELGDHLSTVRTAVRAVLIVWYVPGLAQADESGHAPKMPSRLPLAKSLLSLVGCPGQSRLAAVPQQQESTDSLSLLRSWALRAGPWSPWHWSARCASTARRTCSCCPCTPCSSRCRQTRRSQLSGAKSSLQ